MRTYRTILFLTAFGLIGVFWLSTLFILMLFNAPLLAGPEDEANRALVFFLRDTAVSLSMAVALFAYRRRMRSCFKGKARE